MKTRNIVILLIVTLLAAIILLFVATNKEETPSPVSYPQTESRPMPPISPSAKPQPTQAPVPATEDEGPEEIVICTPGDTQPCQCRDGQPGIQTCNTTGTAWSICQCDLYAEPEENFPGKDMDCVPGDIRSCFCNDGSPGLQECLPDGSTWTDCECQNMEKTNEDEGPVEDPFPY